MWQVLVLVIWETLKTTESFEALAPEIQEVLKTTENGRRLRRNIRKYASSPTMGRIPILT